MRHPNVVVGQKHQTAADIRFVRESHELLDETLAFVIGRMRFARHHNLNRAFRVAQ